MAASRRGGRRTAAQSLGRLLEPPEDGRKEGTGSVGRCNCCYPTGVEEELWGTYGSGRIRQSSREALLGS